MTGRFRRAIRLRAEAGLAVGEVEDDFHHFEVAVRYDGGIVTGAHGRAVRYPWSQCPMAGAALGALKGLPVTTDATAIYRHVDPRLQCTHMLEVAGLAVAQAARGHGARRYDAEVTDPVGGRSEVRLLRDDDVRLAEWVLMDGVVADPAERRGLRPAALRSGELAGLPPEDAEMLLILRRVVGLSRSRGMDVDRFPTAAAMNRGAACFVFRAGVAELAERRYGSVRDHSSGPGPLAVLPSGELR